MYLNTTSCISHVVFEYMCPMIPCNCSQNVWDTEGELFFFCGHSNIHGTQLRIQVFWNVTLCYGASCYRRPEGMFLRDVGKHTPQDTWVSSEKAWFPITLLRENQVCCNINLFQFYMAICEMVIKLRLLLLRLYCCTECFFAVFRIHFYISSNWRGIHNYLPNSRCHYLQWKYKQNVH
jgi:hypothetical protein